MELSKLDLNLINTETGSVLYDGEPLILKARVFVPFGVSTKYGSPRVCVKFNTEDSAMMFDLQEYISEEFDCEPFLKKFRGLASMNLQVPDSALFKAGSHVNIRFKLGPVIENKYGTFCMRSLINVFPG